MARKSTETRGLMLRLPEGLRRRLEREAEQHGRSMNAEIIYRLEQSVSGTVSLQGLADILDSLRLGIQESIIRGQERDRWLWEELTGRLEKILHAVEPDLGSNDSKKADG